MRKLILSLTVVSLFITANAQFSIAIVVGPQVNAVSPNFSLQPDTSSTYSITKHTGLNFGFIANSSLNKKQTLFFRTGAVYSAKGSQTFQSFDTTNVNVADGDQHLFEATTNLKVNYIDIPVNLLYKFPLKGKTKFLLGVGGQASLFYNGSTDFTRATVDTARAPHYKQVINEDLPVGTADNKYRTIHFSANALTGFEFGRAFITIGYSHGLTEFFKNDDGSFRHNTLTFNLGIFLGNPHSVKANVVKDRDKDGIPDDEDQCPDLPGNALTKGCPDKDGDGIADKDDRCPSVPGTLQYHGCPVPDRDKDGVADDQDKCPDVAGLKKYNGCPVPDSDHDGVNDEEDQCPTIAGDKDNHGCPKITKEEQQKIDYAAKRIQFEFKSIDISPSSFTVLDEVVDILKKNPTLNIRVEGHSSGPAKESNTVLSQKRADSVKDYFINKGISSNRIASVGMGSSKHISKDGDTKENPIDRRVELILFQ
jgi:OOP family OmpA-OmpF porin